MFGWRENFIRSEQHIYHFAMQQNAVIGRHVNGHIVIKQPRLDPDGRVFTRSNGKLRSDPTHLLGAVIQRFNEITHLDLFDRHVTPRCFDFGSRNVADKHLVHS